MQNVRYLLKFIVVIFIGLSLLRLISIFQMAEAAVAPQVSISVITRMVLRILFKVSVVVEEPLDLIRLSLNERIYVKMRNDRELRGTTLRRGSNLPPLDTLRTPPS